MLRLPFELSLALRYLRPKRTFVSIITLLCVAGVTIGVAVLIIVTAVMSGFDAELRQKLIGFNAHLKIGVAGAPLQDADAVMKIARDQPHVRGVAPFVMSLAMMQTQPDPHQGKPQTFAPFIRGMDPELEGQVSAMLTNRIVAGRFDLRGNGLLIGATLADDLEIDIGDRVAVYSPHSMEQMLQSSKTTSPVLALAENFEVRGIFRVGHYEMDRMFVGMSLANAQDMNNYGASVSGITVMLDDFSEATTRAVQQKLRDALGPPFRVVSWMEENSVILGAIEDEKSALLVILFFVMIVAAFCIVCSQIAFVIRKTREIGILKGLGATTGQVMGVFFLQSFAVGCIGVVCGWLAGLGGVAAGVDPTARHPPHLRGLPDHVPDCRLGPGGHCRVTPTRGGPAQ